MDDLYEALTRASHDMEFDHFALAVELGFNGAGTSVLVHDYPASWADVYIGFNLFTTDPVRRAGEHSLLAFLWSQIADLIPLTESELITLETGQRHGLVDGFTVPRHLPGSIIGNCTFVNGSSRALPLANLVVADTLGAAAIARASQLCGWNAQPRQRRLTDRQRDCVLWAARGKTDWEIAMILGISHQTVIQHLKDARCRYGTNKRALLILFALFDGVISFSDVFRWRI